jgi:hypothetical protein
MRWNLSSHIESLKYFASTAAPNSSGTKFNCHSKKQGHQIQLLLQKAVTPNSTAAPNSSDTKFNCRSK